MDQRAIRAPQRYDTSVDRAGLALGAGSLVAGVAIVVLLWSGGQRDLLALASGWLIGALFSALAITAVGGPLWLVLHVAGLRRARHAAIAGAVTALAIFVGAQTYGFGLLAMPAMDGRALLFRWISAIATSALFAGFAALVGVLMWRIAYRRVD